MELPFNIRIAGFDYEIVPTEKKLVAKKKDVGYEGTGNIELRGQCDYVSQKIDISTCFPEDAIKQTLLHELVHAISNHYKVPLPEDIETMEEVVDSISCGLFQVFKDNPELLKLFVDQPEGLNSNEFNQEESKEDIT